MRPESAAAARERAGIVVTGDLDRYVARRRVESGELVVAGRRSYRAITTPETPEQRLHIARAEVGDPMWFTGSAALRAYDVAHPPPWPRLLDAAVPNNRDPIRVPGVRIVRAGVADLAGARVQGGHPVLSLEVVLRHTARMVSRSKAITLLQDELRLRRTTHRRLLSACGRGRAGSTALRAALDVAGDGAHSRQERRVNAALLRRGATGFRRGASVVTDDGTAYWIDFLWELLRAGVEVNGDLHLDPVQAAYDARRLRRVLTERGLVLLPLTTAEVDHDVDGAVDEVIAFLTSRARELGVAWAA